MVELFLTVRGERWGDLLELNRIDAIKATEFMETKAVNPIPFLLFIPDTCWLVLAVASAFPVGCGMGLSDTGLLLLDKRKP
jgi:hypothetical protein